MAYCRFSSDDFRCDVYVYATDTGYTVHAAGNRPVLPNDYPTRQLPAHDAPSEDWTTYQEIGQTQREMRRNAPREYLDHPDAGESKHFTEPRDAATYLTELSTAGYRVPAHVITDLIAEADAEDAADTASIEHRGHDPIPSADAVKTIED